MVFELTGQFVNFLPAIIGIAIGLIVGMLFKTDAIYEKSLEGFIAEEKIYKNFTKITWTAKVLSGSKAAEKPVREITWPANGLIVSIVSVEGELSVPDGETVLKSGDTLTFVCETDDEAEISQYLASIVGEQNFETK